MPGHNAQTEAQRCVSADRPRLLRLALRLCAVVSDECMDRAIHKEACLEATRAACLAIVVSIAGRRSGEQK